MDNITVCILNYKRPQNLIHDILPKLESNQNISLIVIGHGNPAAVFGLDKPLKQNNYIMKDKILHVGNYEENATYCCWRRWALIKLLVDRQIIKTKYIFSQDDDILFEPGEIERMLKAHQSNKGILISGAPGRNTLNDAYSYAHVSGRCEIVLGRAIFGKTETIYNAVASAEKLSIPLEILKEDDICISFLTKLDQCNYITDCHFSIKSAHLDLEDDFALCKLGNRVLNRDAAVKYFISNHNILLNQAPPAQQLPVSTVQPNSIQSPRDPVTCYVYWDKGVSHMPPFIKYIYEHNIYMAKKYNFTLILVDDSNVHTFFRPPKQFVKLAPNFRSDIVRFNILHLVGGIWLDTDGIITDDMNKLWQNFLAGNKAMMLDVERDDKKSGNIGCASLVGLPNTDTSRFCLNHITSLLDSISDISTLKWDFLGPTTVSMVSKIYPEQVKINRASQTSQGCNYILHHSWRPGLEHSSWLLGPVAKDKAEEIIIKNECFYIFTWSMYRINNIGDNIVDYVFNNRDSLFYHLIKISKAR